MNSRHLNGEGREVRPATKGAGVVRAPAAVAGVAAAAARMLYGAMRFFNIMFGFLSIFLSLSKVDLKATEHTPYESGTLPQQC